MTLHLGNVDAGSTLYIPFHTFDSNGASITLTGLATSDLEIYKNGSVTQRSSDVGYTLLDTDGIDFDGLTGIHGFSIDLADNTDAGFYAAGSFYWVVVSSVTVDTRTVNFVAATFRIGPAAANVTQLLGTAWLAPGTAGTPDVNTKLAGGTAWGSGAITAASIAADAITAAKIADNAIDAGAFAADAITAAKLAADVTTELQSGLATAAALDAVDNFLDTEIAAIKAVTDLLPDGGALTSLATQASVNTIDDFLDTEVVAIKAKTDNLPSDPADASDIAALLTAIDDFIDTEVAAIKAKTDNLPASPAATGDIPSAAAIADAVLDEDMTAHQTQGTLGQAIGDPVADSDTIWALANTNLNATVSSRASQTSLDTVDDFLDTEIAAIKAKTDNLPSDPADDSDLDTQLAALSTLLTTVAGYLDTEVAAIKAKTDNLPSDPADQSAVEAAILAAWTTAMTEAYRGTNAAPTPVQALFEILAHLGESSISGTTKTLKKLDGSTTAKTFTLNSATTPTAITETT